MPLRKKGGAAPTSKPRKRSIEKAKKETPAEQNENRIEYYVDAFFSYDKNEHVGKCAFRVRTERLFSSLEYGVSVEIEREKNVVDLGLFGLRTKQSYAVKPAPAVSIVEIEETIGAVTVNAVKPDGAINSAEYEFNPYTKTMTLVNEFLPEKKNNRLFCRFGVAEELHTFAE
ncbi:MAG: hypothetical protein GF419_00705 [Ignavibacteriales bacterium]|jgi:hypothetical protein|nr:hypothetical protein [Ignavibacteriales bacterium]